MLLQSPVTIHSHSLHICPSLSLFAGFLLEGVTPTAPPDVPPRNPTMSRMNNTRLIAGAVANNPNDLNVDFEPSCLVRTPSGNVYIPSGNLSEYFTDALRYNLYVYSGHFQPKAICKSSPPLAKSHLAHLNA